MLLKRCTQYVNNIWKIQQWPQDWKRSVFIPIPKKGNVQTTVQLHSFCILVRLCSKSFKLGFSSTWTENFQIFKLDLEKAEEPEIKVPTLLDHRESKGMPKNIYFCFIDYTNIFDCVDHNTLWKILKDMGISTTLPDSCETCMRVKKHQLELDTTERLNSNRDTDFQL